MSVKVSSEAQHACDGTADECTEHVGDYKMCAASHRATNATGTPHYSAAERMMQLKRLNQPAACNKLHCCSCCAQHMKPQYCYSTAYVPTFVAIATACSSSAAAAAAERPHSAGLRERELRHSVSAQPRPH
eukprot:4132-Heterococcus_DN1.PRE.1